MLLFANDGRLSRKAAAEQLGVTTRTIDKWTHHGLRGVQLIANYVGGRVYYTERQLRDFQAAVDQRRESEVRRQSRADLARRKRGHAAAEAYLERIGLGRKRLERCRYASEPDE